MLSRRAAGNLASRYRAVLRKCRLLNLFGSLALAGMLTLGGTGVAFGGELTGSHEISGGTYENMSDNSNFRESLLSPVGGVFYFNNADVTISDGAVFKENYSPRRGGAIYTVDTNLSISGATFEGNYVDWNSENSIESKGGALNVGGMRADSGSVTDISNSVFTGNHAGAMGGAIYAGLHSTINIKDTTFIGNYTEDREDPNRRYFGGGAIYGSGTDTEHSTVNISGGLFENNRSTSGGAIKGGAYLNISGGTQFINNTAIDRGGAISYTTGMYFATISDATFTGNTAESGEGGAIYVERPNGRNVVSHSLIFSGSNLFSGNTASGSANDIHNYSSSVRVDAGTTDLQSGYSQNEKAGSPLPDLQVGSGAQLAAASMDLQAGTANVEPGGALGYGTDIAGLQAAISNAQDNGVDTSGGVYAAKSSLDLANAGLGVGQAAGGPGTAAFGPSSALVLDQEALGDAAAFTNVTTASMDSGSTVHVQNARAGQKLAPFSDSGNNPLAYGTPRLSTDNSMISIAMNPDGTLSTGVGDVSSVLPGLTPSLAAVLSGMYADGLNDADSAHAGAAFLSRLTHQDYMMGDARGAVRALESAARAGLITVPHMSWAAVNAANAAVAERTSLMRSPGSSMQTQAAADSGQTGASAGDDVKTGLGMWVMPLYQSWSSDGQKGGNLKLDVDGELGGVALGGDYTFANAIRAGITFNVGGGSADGEGDFNKTSNDFTFWGVGAYAGWNPGNLGLTADVNYTRVDNEVEQDMPAALGMGSKLESDIDSHAISAGLRGEYRIEAGSIDITPHAGVRYTHLRIDDYDLNSAAGTVLEGDSVSQDIWTFPVGVTLSSDFETENGWLIRPSLDLSVIPAAGDLDARGDVRFTGVNGVADVKAEVVDDVIYSGQLGLDFGNDDVKVGLDYNLQTGEDTLAHGVFATFRYEF